MMTSFKVGKGNGVGEMIQLLYRRPCLVPSIPVGILQPPVILAPGVTTASSGLHRPALTYMYPPIQAHD